MFSYTDYYRLASRTLANSTQAAPPRSQRGTWPKSRPKTFRLWIHLTPGGCSTLPAGSELEIIVAFVWMRFLARISAAFWHCHQRSLHSVLIRQGWWCVMQFSVTWVLTSTAPTFVADQKIYSCNCINSYTQHTPHFGSRRTVVAFEQLILDSGKMKMIVCTEQLLLISQPKKEKKLSRLHRRRCKRAADGIPRLCAELLIA